MVPNNIGGKATQRSPKTTLGRFSAGTASRTCLANL